MATVFDASGLLGILTPIFIFIFVFVMLFALMQKMKILSDKPGIHALISFCLAFLFFIIPETRQIVSFMTPWFVVLIFLGVIILMGLMFLGFKEEGLIEGMKNSGAVVWIAIVGGVVLFLYALGKVFGPSILEPGGEGVTGSIRSVLFNPKVLTVVLILFIAAEVVRKVGFSKS